MIFTQHRSGSAGNLYEIRFNNGNRLLIEAGITWKKMLSSLKYDLCDIKGCFVSHLDQDHSKSIKNVIDAGFDVYSTEGTFDVHGLTGNRRAKVVKDKDLIRLDGFEVYCFDVNHDVPALGFVVRENDEYLLFATDCSHITQKFMIKFSIIAIECSFNADTLAERVAAGEINETYAKRLIDSHMSKQETIRYLDEFCDLDHCRQIHLLHMSDSNIIREKTAREIEDKFMIETVTV